MFLPPFDGPHSPPISFKTHFEFCKIGFELWAGAKGLDRVEFCFVSFTLDLGLVWLLLEMNYWLQGWRRKRLKILRKLTGVVRSVEVNSVDLKFWNIARCVFKIIFLRSMNNFKNRQAFSKFLFIFYNHTLLLLTPLQVILIQFVFYLHPVSTY